MEKVKLGKTNIEVSRIGFGALTIGKSQLNLEEKKGAEIIKYALSKGINFIDTAQYYETYNYIYEAIKEDVYSPIICSKCLSWTYSDMENAILQACKELHRDYIDIFLMHEVRPDEERSGAFNCLLDYKKKGIVKAIGISTHHVDVVEKYAVNKDIDVIFPLINCDSLGIRNGNSQGSKEEMEAAIKIAHKNRIGIFSMKVFGGGHLTEKYMEAMNYVFNLDCIDSVMMGFGNIDEVETAISFLKGRLPKDFQPDISRKRTYIELGNCEGCGNCVKRCPNKALVIGENGIAKVNDDICLTCGYCAPVCPVRAIILL